MKRKLIFIFFIMIFKFGYTQEFSVQIAICQVNDCVFLVWDESAQFLFGAEIQNGVKPFTGILKKAYASSSDTISSSHYEFGPILFSMTQSDWVYFKVIDSTGASCEDSMYVHIKELTVFEKDIDTIFDESIILNAGNPGFSYSWSTGDTTQTIEVTEPGLYSVYVTSGTKCRALDTIIIVSAITDIKTSSYNDFKTYPNPVKDHLIIDNSSNIDYKVQLVNINGQVVFDRKLLYIGSNKLNISGLNKGIYLVKIFNDSEVLVRKIILQ